MWGMLRSPCSHLVQVMRWTPQILDICFWLIPSFKRISLGVILKSQYGFGSDANKGSKVGQAFRGQAVKFKFDDRAYGGRFNPQMIGKAGAQAKSFAISQFKNKSADFAAVATLAFGKAHQLTIVIGNRFLFKMVAKFVRYHNTLAAIVNDIFIKTLHMLFGPYSDLGDFIKRQKLYFRPTIPGVITTNGTLDGFKLAAPGPQFTFAHPGRESFGPQGGNVNLVVGSCSHDTAVPVTLNAIKFFRHGKTDDIFMCACFHNYNMHPMGAYVK